MYRLYPFLVICLLLLAGCGGTTPPAGIPPAPSTQTPGAPGTLAAPAYPSDLTRKSMLSGSGGQEQIGPPARPTSGTADEMAGMVSMWQDTPPRAQPQRTVHLPAVSPGVSGLHQGSVGAPDDWTLLLDEDFHDPDPDIWGTGEQTDGGSTQLTGGNLRITAKPGWIVSMTPRPATDLSDGYISATLTVDGDGTAGVVVRAGQDSEGATMYICGAGTVGFFFCYKRTQGHWSVLTSVKDDTIQPGEPILVTLTAVGDQLTLGINDVEVGSFSDDALQHGSWGLFTQADADVTKAVFNHVEIGVPATAPPTATPTARPGRPTRTPTHVASPPSPTPGAGAAGAVIVDNDFENGDTGTWLIGTGDSSSSQVRDGALALSLTRSNLLLINYPDEARDLADAQIDTTMRIEGSTGFAGVFARFQQDDNKTWSMYFCWINNGGRWACGTDVHDHSTLIGSGTLSSITPNENNRLSLRVSGGKIVFQVNDGLVLSSSDTTLARGVWGVWAGTIDQPVAAYFDRVTISEAGAGAEPTAEPTVVPTVASGGPARGTVGERVVSGGLALTVLSVSNEAGTYGDILHLTPEQKYVDADVVFEDVARTSVYYDSAFFKLKDSTGFEYRKAPIDYTLPAFGFGTMVPGEKTRGHLNFIVAKSIGGLQLVCDMAHLANFKTIYIDLGQ
jgi:hypothetical protein